MTHWLNGLFGEVIGLLKQILRILNDPKPNVQLDRIEAGVKQNGEKLDRIIVLVTPPPAVAFNLTIRDDQGDVIAMSQANKGKLKLDINSDGSATATLTLQDAQGFIASLAPGDSFNAFPWASSDPGVAVAPAADNMSAKLTVVLPPANPASPPTGVIITAGPATLTRADGSTAAFAAVDNSADPLNVKAGPAGSFVLSVA